MNRFLIFHRHKGFTWTRDKILNIILIACFCGFIIKHLVLNQTYFIADEILFWVGATAAVSKIVFKILYNDGIYQELKGFMEGSLMVDSQKITIYENEYFFTDIKSIQVSASDYSGLAVERKRYEFEGYSNGVDNYLKIYMNDGKIIRAEFQQISAGLFKQTVETVVPEEQLYKFVFIEKY